MKLFVFGLGYTALRFIEIHRETFTEVYGTVRSDEKRSALESAGISTFRFDGTVPDARLMDALLRSDAILASVPPLAASDPVLDQFSDAIRAAPGPRWIGYLSTVGVYGDAAGGWVGEDTPVDPVNERSRARVLAESAWLDLGRMSPASVQIFRLAGIYGPGRNALRRVMDGSARRVIKPGQIFNRIHVDDIAQVLMASIRSPARNAIYNLADDEPSPPQDVISYAAELLGREPPPEELFAEAKMGAIAESFYQDNKRVVNARIKRDLGVTLKYPTYREGLQALLAAGEGLTA